MGLICSIIHFIKPGTHQPVAGVHLVRAASILVSVSASSQYQCQFCHIRTGFKYIPFLWLYYMHVSNNHLKI